MKPTKKQISSESQIEAMKIAKATQKPGQSKEQTKLISQGIEKGIALYKKQQKEKSRQADRARKKSQKEKLSTNQTQSSSEVEHSVDSPPKKNNDMLPWVLLVVSWIGIVTYIMQS